MHAHRIRTAADTASTRNQTHRDRGKEGEFLDGGNKERVVKGNKESVVR